MNLCKLYKRLPSDERHKWYEDFRRYFLSNKKGTQFSSRASSDMQRMFEQYIEIISIEGNTLIQTRGRIFRSEAMGIEKLAQEFLKTQYNHRKEYIIEYCPEALI